MTEINSERKGQGKKIDEHIQEAIVETFVSMWLSGRRKRGELSADALLDQLSISRPDLAEALPSAQTVRRLISPVRAKLSEGPGEVDQPWSLGRDAGGTDGIDESAVPLILKINKHLSLDIREERRRKGFPTSRLTIREAKWISRLRHAMLSTHTADDSDAPTALEARTLLEMARRYSARELVTEALGGEIDTYDLDMEIAYGVPMSRRQGNFKDLQLWMLSLEMGLIPQSPLGQPEDILERAINFGEVNGNPFERRENIDDLSLGMEAWARSRLFALIRRLEDHNIDLRVRFSSEDWQGSLAGNNLQFRTSADYELTPEILRLIIPLARIDGQAKLDDPVQVRIATAFFTKMQQTLKDTLNDSKVQEATGVPYMKPPLSLDFPDRLK
jgi:hypothetical protein